MYTLRSASSTFLTPSTTFPSIPCRSYPRLQCLKKPASKNRTWTFKVRSLSPELVIHAEPSNALSLPTWIIHVSSVLEWVTAMGLVWRYADVTGDVRWKGLTWGMLPLLGGAMCACTWHFFYNDPKLEALVTLQAALTFIGNGTIGIAAYRLYQTRDET